MRAVPSPRHAGALACCSIVALAGVVAIVLAQPGQTSYAITQSLIMAASFLVAGIAIWFAAPGSTWPGLRAMAVGFLAIALVSLCFAIAGSINPSTYMPRVADLALLGLLVPFVFAARAEFQTHFEPQDRREAAADVTLLALSIAVIVDVAIRPAAATTAQAASAGTYAVLGASIVAIFGALALWTPSTGHLLRFVGAAALAAATFAFGAAWADATITGAPQWIAAAFAVTPPALAAVFLLVPDASGRLRVHATTRIARPVLTSITVIAACAAISIVAIMDGGQGNDAANTVILMMLAAGIVLRILSNQHASVEAYTQARTALDQQRHALRDTDAALERERSSNESLSRSEEHLRLIFEAAVDGFVEMDDAGSVIRANDAFAAMVGMDPVSIAGLSWSTLAAAVDGADADFPQLVHGAQATVSRSDGTTLHLESTASDIPTHPPRRLLLVRDVTPAKIADQTIRSLFQFLQDRDEDRTRLLRRSNAAIEQERNRIARDLHDGPVQGVSAASLSLEAALLMIKAGDADRGMELLVKIREELAGEADALRQLMSGLRPPVLEERGLMPALRETLSRFETDTGIVTTFEGELQRSVARDAETLAYRVVQEALTNIGKHAEATMVTVHVDTDTTQLRVEVEDDGRGFETNRARDYLRGGRVGLASMRERVELASGTFNLRSTPGRGTVVTATIPLDDQLLSVPAI